jgi:hypothetical protein
MRAHKMSVVGRLIILVSGVALGLLIAEGLVRFWDVAPEVAAMTDAVFRCSGVPTIPRSDGRRCRLPSGRRRSEKPTTWDIGIGTTRWPSLQESFASS